MATDLYTPVRRRASYQTNPSARLLPDEQISDNAIRSNPGPNNGIGGSQTNVTSGGTEFVEPSGPNFEELQFTPISFEDAYDFATKVGKENREIYYKNLADPRNRDIALGLIDTDVEGIKRATSSLSPFIREEGNKDTQTNIERAGLIDRFNFSRIPEFNDFNRTETAKTNEYNRSEHERAIQDTGLDFRARIGKVLDDLETQRKGKFGNDVLDTIASNQRRDRGADIAGASGVGARSGAGIDIQDRLDAEARINLALDAQKTLPNVLTQGQNVLQYTPDRAQTLYNQPTAVPLNASNIADKIPVQSNLSAGQLQNSIGTNATNYEVIPASTILSEHLNTQGFNSTGMFQRDATVLNAEQAQAQARDSALQGALNQDRADAAAAAGLKQRQNSELISAGASLLGGVAGGLFSTPAGGGQSVGGQLIGNVVDGIRNIFTTDTPVSGGGTEAAQPIGQNTDGSFIYPDSGGVSQSSIEPIGQNTDGSFIYPSNSETISATEQALGFDTNSQLARTFRETAEPIRDSAIDAKVVSDTSSTIGNWSTLNDSQKMAQSGSIATSVLSSKNIVSPEEGKTLGVITNGLSTISNPNATDAQKAAAAAAIVGNLATTSFSGPANAPRTIAGQPVIGSGVTPDGQPGFMLKDGTVIPQSDIAMASNIQSGIQAFSILNSNATTEQKASALAAVGIQAGAANQIISQVAAGNAMAGLAVFGTAANWDKMNPVQKGASVIQTSNAVLNAFNQTSASSGSSILSFSGSQGGSSAASSASSSFASNAGIALGGAAAIAGIGLGIKQEADVIDAANDMPRSHSVSTATTGSAAAGAAIGAGVGAGAVAAGAATGATVGSYVPIVGTVIGAALGALVGVGIGMTGTGKGSGQIMRDGWRKGMKDAGFITKEGNNAYDLTLADGSKYDIGKDGNFKLSNKAGKERYTFDVDWDNPATAETIPDAHLFAIASGLDPTDQEKFDTFHRATAQIHNAATSNANSVQGIRDNIKSFMQGKVDPRDLAMRVETLRVTNKISEQEYGVYIDRVNKIFGTKLVPTDRLKATSSVIQRLEQSGKNATKYEKQMLKQLTNKDEIDASVKRLQERLRKDAANIL